MSIGTSIESSSGNSSAAFPTKPTDKGRPKDFAFSTRSTASSTLSAISSKYLVSILFSMRDLSTSITKQTPPFIVTARGCAPPIPPQPPVSVSVPWSVPLKRFWATAAKVSYVPCKIPCVPI